MTHPCNTQVNKGTISTEEAKDLADWVSSLESELVAPLMNEATSPTPIKRIPYLSLGLWWNAEARRYDPVKHEIPKWMIKLAERAYYAGGYTPPRIETSVINFYTKPSDFLVLHQDLLEHPKLIQHGSPVAIISTGPRAEFSLGGFKPTDEVVKTLPMDHGDTLVFGGPDRARFHGVTRVSSKVDSQNPRISFTFRQVHWP